MCLESLLIGHAGSANARSNPNAEALFVELPHGGETLFDEIRDLVWTEEGLWLCGEMGVYNGGQPSRFNGSSGFSLFFDPQLNPGRFALHGGNARDSFDRLIIMEDGPLLSGVSRSFHPWPGGSSGEDDFSSPAVHWLVKLPWEGRLDFHQVSNAAQSVEGFLGGSYYVYSRVVSGLLSGDLDINQPVYDSHGRGDGRLSDANSMMLVEDKVPVATTSTMTFSSADVDEVKALDYQPKSLITNQQTYFDWYQLNADDDTDADEMSAELEFFFGTDPTQLEANSLDHRLIEGETMEVEIRMTRSKLAEDVTPSVLSSVDLIRGFPRNDVTLEIEPFDSERDLLILKLPAPEDRQFYEVSVP